MVELSREQTEELREEIDRALQELAQEGGR